MKDYRSVMFSSVSLDGLVRTYNKELETYNKSVKLKIARLKPITKEQINVDAVTFTSSITNNMIVTNDASILAIGSILAVVREGDKYAARAIFFKEYSGYLIPRIVLNELNGSENNIYNEKYIDLSIERLIKLGNKPRDIANYFIYHSDPNYSGFYSQELININNILQELNFQTEIFYNSCSLHIEFNEYDYEEVCIYFDDIFSKRFIIHGRFTDKLHVDVEVTEESQIMPTICDIINKLIDKISHTDSVDSNALLKYMAIKFKLEEVLYGNAVAKTE